MSDISIRQLQKRYKSECYSWEAMKTRCTNPNRDFWGRYGGRGITVCERWTGQDGFRNFLQDMGERPEGMTLDRIDNDGNYEPSNCRWATHVEQAYTTSRARIVTIDGVTDTISGWARRIGIDNRMMFSRLKKYAGDYERGVAEIIATPRLRPMLPRTGLWGKLGDDSPYIGKTFGKLTILQSFPSGAANREVLCSCACGEKAILKLGNVVKGISKSCGCGQGRRPAKPYIVEASHV